MPVMAIPYMLAASAARRVVSESNTEISANAEHGMVIETPNEEG